MKRLCKASAISTKPINVSALQAHNGAPRRRNEPIKLIDAKYQYKKDVPGFKGVSMSEWVPPSEYFSLTYITERLLHTVPLIYSVVASKILFLQRSKTTEHSSLQDYEQYFPPLYLTILWFLRIPLNLFLPADKFVSKPKIAEGKLWQSDEVFAEQRLSGMNPLMLRALTKEDKRMNVLHSASLVVPDAKVTDLLVHGAS
jgi:arachidonate 15-lipoxygenase